MDEVQQGRLDLSLPANLPIPKGPWRNIRPMRSPYIYLFNAVGQVNTSSEGTDAAVSPTDIITAGGSPLPHRVIESTSMAMLSDLSPPPDVPINLSPSDNTRDEYYPSPVSSTGLDWEFSQDSSDQESSVDFVMSEDGARSNSGSE